MLFAVKEKRQELSKSTEVKKKSQLGQFFTPERIAVFMANLFADVGGHCCLLDAGAGIGALSAAFLDRWLANNLHFDRINVEAFEIDQTLHANLSDIFKRYRHSENFNATIFGEDFIHKSAEALCDEKSSSLNLYTHAILNPPYKKLHSHSAHRLALRRVGIETVNLYSAFVALAIARLAPGGQIVAIIPRSFCNGPYYRPFRHFILGRTALRHLHLFESRSRIFKDDAVLQENLIILLERDGHQEPVTISTSTDSTFTDVSTYQHAFDRIVFPDDPEQFIHVPTSHESSTTKVPSTIRYTLTDLGIKVSTGPVVDFRVKTHLCTMPEPGTVPLLYPDHFVGQITTWPIKGLKKPNAIKRNIDTEKWLYPGGCYCVVRRFSSKEEKRRILASVVMPGALDNAPMLGFENHLNVFHENKHGLPEPLAHGLAMFLNTTAVDQYFRRFNGHTQVNATDLKQLKFPSRSALIQLGEWVMQQGTLTQEQIDVKLDTFAK